MRLASRYGAPVMGALFLVALNAASVMSTFEFPDANLRTIQKHFVRMGEFFPVNKPGEVEGLGDDAPLNPEGGSPSKGAFSNMPSLLGAVYLFSAVCFILCLRGLSTPETSKRGNILGMVGMAAAILVTFTENGFGSHYLTFFLTASPAAVLGLYIAQYVSMVEMPQLVALFHSFVGLAAMLVGFANFHSPDGVERTSQVCRLIEVFGGEFIAAVTFTGSLVAAGKLHDIIDAKSLKVPGRHAINAATLSAIAVLGGIFCVTTGHLTRMICLYAASALSMWLGFHLVAAIGGADMPVVISMLNSYSGFATAASGFMLDNNLLIVAGSLIGSSGAILSYIMCKGMNRDFLSVILGGFDAPEEVTSTGPQGTVKQIGAESVADELLGARKVLIVPGYGMAVSKCQVEVADIAKMLLTHGITVEFGIHPVAGRMPGHMNVLLAEAEVPYKIVKELSEVNPEITSYDVALVVGANDTVNPAALDHGSKIAGMPVIEVWRAKKVVVLKRSMAAGYAAIENPLFFLENCRMLFGNAKSTSLDIYAKLSEKAQFLPTSERPDLEAGLLESGERSLEIDSSSWPYPRRTIGVLKDFNGTASMVPLSPKFVPKLRKLGYRVLVEGGAGVESGFTDEAYTHSGAEIVRGADQVIQGAEIILRVSVPPSDLIARIPRDKVLISYLFPSTNAAALEQLARQGLTALAVDEVPRITRAQKLDVKSAMQGLQGYRAVIEAFHALPKISKASITAAGRVEAAKVFVIGAGVAGLQAISTAHGLGAQVFANDIRSATREEVESCGGKFIGLRTDERGEGYGGYAREMGDSFQRAQQELIANTIRHCDVVICTASIPGKSSPKLISNDMLRSMKPGSVIVDLATEFGDVRSGWGGNVQGAPKDGETVIEGVKIIGRSKIETRMPAQASELFSMNMVNLLEELGGGGNFRVNMDDEVIRSLTAVYQGRIVWSPQQAEASRTPPRGAAAPIPSSQASSASKQPTILHQLITSDSFFAMCLICTAALVALLGISLDPLELKHLTLFTLALVVGYYSVWSVTPALHTPLMSVTNALSGVIIVGSMLEYGPYLLSGYTLLAMVATFLASVNIAGGFFVTHRMLKMFQ